MRPFLALGPLIILCGSAGAAPVHHPRHVVSHHSQHGLNDAAPGWLGAYAGPRPQDPYYGAPSYGAPSYNDPSKFGGDEALPIRQ